MADYSNELNYLNTMSSYDVVDDAEFLEINHSNHPTVNNDFMNCQLSFFGDVNTDTGTPFFELDPDHNVNQYKENVSQIVNTCDYYKDENFAKKSLKYENDFSLYHINIRSLPAHYNEFLLSLRNIKSCFKIFGMCETWLHDVNSDMYSIPNYRGVHKTRNGRRGGGVSLFIHESIEFTNRDDLSLLFNDVIESVFVEIDKSVFCSTTNIIIGEVYRPPNTSVDEFNECLEHLLTYVGRSNALCYLMSDFNINLLNVNTHEQSAEFLNLLLSYSFIPLISRPTRCTGHSITLIDNIFTNSLKSLHESSLAGIFLHKISDHFPVFFLNKFKGKVVDKEFVIFKETINPRNINNFKDLLINHNWDSILDCNDVNLATSQFLHQISYLYKICFPIKKIVVKRNHKPWVTQCLLNSIKRKNKLYKAYLQNPCDDTKLRFSQYRNKLTHLLRISERKYYAKSLSKYVTDIRKSWQIVNEILDHRKSNDCLPNMIESNEGDIIDPINIANHFNKYFSSVGVELAKNIKSTSINPLNYIKSPKSNVFELNEINESDLKKVFLSLKNSAPGYDGIRPSVLKSVFDQVKKPLVHLINMSFRNGTFPEKLKQAVITPIYKQGNKNLVENYRPISVLSVFSKIFEKLMYKQLNSYLIRNNILYLHQYGFQEGYSTDHALITATNFIYNALNEKMLSIAVSIDLKKAFDTINHSILLRKLSVYGIRDRALSWFTTYIQNRCQKVKYSSTVLSQNEIMKCGVPQGSTLGPLLFLLYVNDLPNTSDILSFILFADDTSIFIKGNELNDLVNSFNLELKKLSTWFAANQLSLNVKKTNCILFTNDRVNSEIKLMIDRTQIAQVQEIKFLGILIDDKMTWKSHINYISNKISKSIGILYKVRHVLSNEWKLNLYKTFVLPYLNYCNIIWASTYKTNIKPLLIKQKRALKIVLNLHRLTPSRTVFEMANVHSVYEMNDIHVTIFMFKYMRNLLPLSFTNMFQTAGDIHSISTRNASNIYLPFPRIEKFKFSITYSGAALWNTLPDNVKLCNNLSQLKSNIKKFMLISTNRKILY